MDHGQTAIQLNEALARARDCLRRGQADQALSMLSAVAADFPESFELFQMAGAIALHRGENAMALEWLERALSLNDQHAAVYANYGLALRRVGKLDQAGAAFESALARNPGDVAALSNLGMLYADAGQSQQAADCFRRASQQAPGNPAILCNYAAALLADGKAQQALDPLQQAARLAPGDFTVWFNLAQAQRRCNDLNAAVASLQRCMGINRQHAGVWFEMAQIHRLAGQVDQALEAARAGLDIDSTDVDGWRLLGTLEKRKGNPDKARDALNRALSISPDDVASQHLLDSLDQRSSETAPAQYVRELFDGYAPRFEQHLRQELQYQVPEMLAQLLGDNPPRTLGKAVDLGCGTGLMAPLLRPHCRELVGVDLSSRMLDIASQREQYQNLAEADVEQWLLACEPGELSLAVAADVLCYIGNLEPVHQALSRALSLGGRWLFSVELLAEDDSQWTLRPSGRFAHTRSFVELVLQRGGFRLIAADVGVGRRDEGQPIEVLCVLAERQD